MEIFSIKQIRPMIKDGCRTYREVSGSLNIDPDEGSVTVEDVNGLKTEFRVNPLILKTVGVEIKKALENSKRRSEIAEAREAELHELRVQEAQANAYEATARAEEAKLRHQIEMARLQKQLLKERKELREMEHQQGKKSLTHNHNKIMGKKNT